MKRRPSTPRANVPPDRCRVEKHESHAGHLSRFARITRKLTAATVPEPDSVVLSLKGHHRLA